MLNKIRKLREKKGFTLVELIVVIAIIAILTAVLVPLISNWTQQAAYTMLQDSAQTISNTTNEAMSKVMMGGAIKTMDKITGQKGASGDVTIKVYNGDTDLSGDSSDGQKVAGEVKKMLNDTLPFNCAFIVTVENGAVRGVVYTNKSNTVPGITADDIVKSGDYYNDASGSPIGVSGIYKK